MLLDGLKPDNNLLSLDHEVTTAVHFVSMGFEQVMTTRLLQSPDRVHIHSVAYRSHGKVTRPADQTNALMESGIGTFMRNPDNLSYNDPRLRPLR